MGGFAKAEHDAGHMTRDPSKKLTRPTEIADPDFVFLQGLHSNRDPEQWKSYRNEKKSTRNGYAKIAMPEMHIQGKVTIYLLTAH